MEVLLIKAGTLLTDTLGANPRARLRVLCDEADGYAMVRLAGYVPFVIRVSTIGPNKWAGLRYSVVAAKKPELTIADLHNPEKFFDFLAQ